MVAPSTITGPRALLLGGPGRLPFNGQLRLVLERGAGALHAVGALASSAEPPVAFAAAAVVRQALQGVQGAGRFDLLRSAWDQLAAIELAALGPAAGEDLALLLLAADADGLAVAGTGLVALYAWSGGVVSELVPPAHPLLALRGLPAEPPGVFTPNAEPQRVIGAAASGALDPRSWPSWPAACGFYGEVVR